MLYVVVRSEQVAKRLTTNFAWRINQTMAQTNTDASAVCCFVAQNGTKFHLIRSTAYVYDTDSKFNCGTLTL